MTEKREHEASQNGSCHGYRVQARVEEVDPHHPITYLKPRYGDKRFILTDKWTDIDPFESLKDKLEEEWFKKHPKQLWNKFLETNTAKKIIKDYLVDEGDF